MWRKSRAGIRAFAPPFASELLLFLLRTLGGHCVCICKDGEDPSVSFAWLHGITTQPVPGQAKSVGRICKEFFKGKVFTCLPVRRSEEEAFLCCGRLALSALPDPCLYTWVSFKGHILDYIVCSTYPHVTIKWEPKGSVLQQKSSGYRLAVGFAGHLGSLLSLCFSFCVSPLSYICGKFRDFYLMCFYIIQVRCALGHLVYHLGGNKTSFILLTDWWIWSLEMWGQPEVKYSSKMQREFDSIKSTWSQGFAFKK